MGELIVGIAMLAAVAASAMDQRPAPVVVRAEACLENNVARVVAIESNAHAAASFLVDFVCAREIERAARYERNLVFVEAGRAMAQSAMAHSTTPASSSIFSFAAEVDPETGDIITPAPNDSKATPFLQTTLPSVSKQAEFVSGWSVPARLRVRAGELVLDAKESSKKPPRR
ncbi:MAG: hypothetical protein ACK41C_09415 [Phenylobacterium sp.]|uniref:hypothetical protein n=1 Tax=Phenylobacterium sp. TaxID=1871053 RepID=UPI00391AEB0E